MYCKNLKFKLNHKLSCNLTNKQITLLDCNKCALFQSKGSNPIKHTQNNKSLATSIKTPIKRVSNKRVFVSKETYNIVFERDKGRCVLCGTTQNLQYHHIFYRSQRKDLINEPSNGIMLCINCHSLCHSNKKKYQKVLLDLVLEQKKEESD